MGLSLPILSLFFASNLGENFLPISTDDLAIFDSLLSTVFSSTKSGILNADGFSLFNLHAGANDFSVTIGLLTGELFQVAIIVINPFIALFSSEDLHSGLLGNLCDGLGHVLGLFLSELLSDLSQLLPLANESIVKERSITNISEVSPNFLDEHD